MGGYPPGVTGSEDHFGPRRTRADIRECTREDATIFALDPNVVRDLQTWASDQLTYTLDLESRIKQMLRFDLNEITTTCAFSGEVDIDYFSAHAEWTCPVCGHTHEEDYEEYGND